MTSLSCERERILTIASPPHSARTARSPGRYSRFSLGGLYVSVLGILSLDGGHGTQKPSRRLYYDSGISRTIKVWRISRTLVKRYFSRYRKSMIPEGWEPIGREMLRTRKDCCLLPIMRLCGED